jgi:hypothetical protein
MIRAMAATRIGTGQGGWMRAVALAEKNQQKTQPAALTIRTGRGRRIRRADRERVSSRRTRAGRLGSATADTDE